MAMLRLVSRGNKGDAKNDGVACATAQKVVNVNTNVAREEGMPGLSPWWMARAECLLMGFVPRE